MAAKYGRRLRPTTGGVSEKCQHQNGSSIVIVSPIYASLNLPPIRYRVKKVDGQKEFIYSKEEIQDLINQGKLKRIH